MTTDWAARLSAPIEAAEHGVETTDAQFGSVHTGPLNFGSIDYPAAQTYVEELSRSSGVNWELSIGTTLYYEWDRDTELTGDIVHPLAAVIEATLAAFDATECIGNYHPSRIDFFSGEPANSLVLAVSIQFRVTLLLDPDEFA